jgi:hypothetical protein
MILCKSLFREVNDLPGLFLDFLFHPMALPCLIFDNTTVATAIADRLVHNSEVIVMEGPSYRTKNKSSTDKYDTL